MRFWLLFNRGMSVSSWRSIVPMFDVWLEVKQKGGFGDIVGLQDFFNMSSYVCAGMSTNKLLYGHGSLETLESLPNTMGVDTKYEFPFGEIHVSPVKLIWGSLDEIALSTNWPCCNFSITNSESVLDLKNWRQQKGNKVPESFGMLESQQLQMEDLPLGQCFFIASLKASHCMGPHY